jgi:hypothetical protein
MAYNRLADPDRVLDVRCEVVVRLLTAASVDDYEGPAAERLNRTFGKVLEVVWWLVGGAPEGGQWSVALWR